MITTCSLTNNNFETSNQDLSFFDRVSPVIAGQKHTIPPPTLSPEARLIRRMTWRNDRSFFKRPCDLTGKDFISIYPENTRFPVYHPDAWWSDSWDAQNYGRDFDFGRTFFEQWHTLMNCVPRRGIDVVNCQNSNYCNYCGDAKNCYLDIAGEGNEDCYYNLFTKYSKDCVDCTFVYSSELMYECINCYNCQDCIFSTYLQNCNQCSFCFDLKSCSNCLFSSNLRHKEYYIFNKPHSKEDYEKKLKELKLHSRASLDRHIETWLEVIDNAVHRDMYILNSENCTGDDIVNSKNCHYAFNIADCEDCKYLYDVLEAKNCYDLNYSLYKPEASYELISTLNMSYSAFCMASHYSANLFYCDQCENSSELFGCIALNQKHNCILNKSYTKHEYEQLVTKIIGHMRETKEWGEFFPSSLSPWSYHETVAQEYFPLTAEEARELGYVWKDYSTETNITAPDTIPDTISSEEIHTKNFKCQATGKAFKFIKQEVSFYQKMNSPLPKHYPNRRHLNRLGMRNARNLYQRKCSSTGKDIISTYSALRPEKVYCEEAYLEALN